MLVLYCMHHTTQMSHNLWRTNNNNYLGGATSVRLVSDCAGIFNDGIWLVEISNVSDLVKKLRSIIWSNRIRDSGWMSNIRLIAVRQSGEMGTEIGRRRLKRILSSSAYGTSPKNTLKEVAGITRTVKVTNFGDKLWIWW